MKPWRKSMWCVGKITAEYRERMYSLLELYARPYNAQEPVICLDEKSKQLLDQTRAELPARPGRSAKQDYEYKRHGTCNIFVAVEPQAGHREIAVTARRTKVDFVAFIMSLLSGIYSGVKILHLVMDNLNTHFASSFVEVLGEAATAPILERIQFHYTPKHASWLNMAELEIGIMDRQCTGRGMDRAETVVFLGDGAHGIWNVAEKNFSFAVHILDLYHALVHLETLAKDLYGENAAAIALAKIRWRD